MTLHKDFKNFIIVTGSSKGIGNAIACHLACPDTAVIVTYHSSEDSAKSCMEKIKGQGGTCIAIHTNLATVEGTKKVVQEAVENFGEITGIVNNAGIRHAGPFEATTEEDYIRVFGNDVKSTIFMISAAVPHLKEGASIVNISSAITHHPFADQTVYTAGKGAIEAFTRSLAIELAPEKIRVNSVSPGFTDTDMLPEEQYEMGKKMAPLGRVGTPDDIAKVVRFFLSEDSAWLTSQNVLASGGFGFSM
ncbi:hypothetical protein HDU97_002346 [Phlyctochytrium planicorne]|nr:hypothetical protein HDU97_002346 [Phlyctochytrium planicorne]